MLQRSDTFRAAGRVTGSAGKHAGTDFRHNRTLVATVRTAAGLLLKPLFELSVTGTENLPRAEGFVLLPKHQRWEDIPLLGLAFPWPLFYVAKQELFACPASDWFFRSLGGIPLHRRHLLKSRACLRALVQLLEQGEGIVIFPEGTYFENRMGPARTGLIRFIRARLPEVPYVPVGVRYRAAGCGWRVAIVFGRPVRAGAAHIEAFAARMMDEIARLSDMPTASRNEKP